MSDLLGSQGIFYPQNVGRLGRKMSFSTATGVYTRHAAPCIMKERPASAGWYRRLCRLDCHWVERTSSRGELHPLKSKRLSRRTVTSTTA
jgi:hypothetical protein